MAHTSQDDYLKAIGELIVEYSNVEFWIGRFISFLISVADWKLGEIVIAELSVPAKLALLLSLYRYRMDDDRASIKKLASILEHVKQANKKRNDLIHSNWGIGANFALRQKATAKYEKGYQFDNKLITVREIKEIAESMRTQSTELSKSLVAYREYEDQKNRSEALERNSAT